MTAAANPRQTTLRAAIAFLPGLALLALGGCHRDRQVAYYAPAPTYTAPQPVQVPAPAPEQAAYCDQGQYAQPAVVYATPTVVTQQVPVYVPQPVPVYVQNTIVRDRVIVKDRDDRDRRTLNDRRDTDWSRHTPAPVTHGPIPVTRKPEPVKTDFRTVDKDRRTTASSTKVTQIVETTRPTPPARTTEKVAVKVTRDKNPDRLAADTDRLDKKDRDRR